jgi:hypothetical protein
MANHPDKQYDPLMVLTKCTRCDTQVGERVEDVSTQPFHFLH